MRPHNSASRLHEPAVFDDLSKLFSSRPSRDNDERAIGLGKLEAQDPICNRRSERGEVGDAKKPGLSWSDHGREAARTLSGGRIAASRSARPRASIMMAPLAAAEACLASPTSACVTASSRNCTALSARAYAL